MLNKIIEFSTFGLPLENFVKILPESNVESLFIDLFHKMNTTFRGITVISFRTQKVALLQYFVN